MQGALSAGPSRKCPDFGQIPCRSDTPGAAGDRGRCQRCRGPPRRWGAGRSAFSRFRCSRFSAFSRCFCCRASSFSRLVAPGAAMADLPLVKQVQCPSGRARVKPLAPPRSQSEQAPGRGCRGYSRAPTSPPWGQGQRTPGSMRLAAVQMASGPEKARNVETAIRLVRRAASLGADLHRAPRERGLDGPGAGAPGARPSRSTGPTLSTLRPARPGAVGASARRLGARVGCAGRAASSTPACSSVPTAGGWRCTGRSTSSTPRSATARPTASRTRWRPATGRSPPRRRWARWA